MSELGKNIKISITGDLGSGKSTVCRLIKEKYGFNVYSIGMIQRTMAQKYNMTTYEFNKYMESHPEIDHELDSTLSAIGKRPENMLLDSRMAWHFVPDSFKVYLAVDIEEAAARIISDQRGSVETYSNIEEAKSEILRRKLSENIRYLEKYSVDCADFSHFDLVIHTTNLTPQEVVNTIMSHPDISSRLPK